MAKTTFEVDLRPAANEVDVPNTDDVTDYTSTEKTSDTGLFTAVGDSMQYPSVWLGIMTAFVVTIVLFKKVKKNNKSPIFVPIRTRKRVFSLHYSTVIIFLLMLGCLGSFIAERSMIFASKREYEIAVQAQDKIRLDANILDTNNIVYIKSQIKIPASSDPYKVYFWADDAKMINVDDSSKYLTSVTDEGELKNNTFGFSLTKPDNNTYMPINNSNTKDLIYESAERSDDGKTLDIYIGVRSKDLPKGKYKITLNYMAIGVTDYIMQDMTAEMCDSLETGVKYGFIDSRDGQEYEVVKQSDGLCWMNESLKLKTNEGDILTSEDTNINTPSESIVESKDEKSILSYTVPDSLLDATIATYQKLSASSYEFDNQIAYSYSLALLGDETGNNSICPKGWELPDKSDYVSLLDDYGSTKEQSGNRYYFDDNSLKALNFNDDVINAGSLAKEAISLEASLSEDDAMYGSMLEALLSEEVIDILAENVQKYANLFYRDSNFVRYATLVYKNNNYFSDRFYPTSLDLEGIVSESNNPIANSAMIRCVSSEKLVHVNYYSNTDSSVSNMPSAQILTVGKEQQEDFISDKIPTRNDGMIFAGWAEENNKQIITYRAGEQIRVEKDTNLYAVWAKEDIVTLQNITQEVCSQLSYGDRIYAKDARDGKIYSFSKYTDGSCWIDNNLDLELSTQTKLTSKTTDLANETDGAKKNPETEEIEWTPTADTSSEEEWKYSNEEGIHCFEDADGNCKAYSYSPGRGGNLYNSYAIYANTNFANTVDGIVDTETIKENSMSNSICPSGWTLPSEDQMDNVYYDFMSNGTFGSVNGFYISNELSSIEENIFNSKAGYLNNIEINDEDDDDNTIIYGAIATKEGIITFYKMDGQIDMEYGSYSDNGAFHANIQSFGYAGVNIKCILKQEYASTETEIIYDKNTDDEVKNMPANSNDPSGISSEVPTRNGYIFKGWAIIPEELPEDIDEGQIYEPGYDSSYDLSEFQNKRTVLYARWLKYGGLMQDMTESVCDNMQINEEVYFKDSRDDNLYAVIKQTDGNCWMNENLLLQTGKVDIVIDSTNTDIQSESRVDRTNHRYQYRGQYRWTEAALLKNEDQNTYLLPQPVDYEIKNMSGNTIENTICPKGWTLPTQSQVSSLIDENGIGKLIYSGLKIDYNVRGEDGIYEARYLLKNITDSKFVYVKINDVSADTYDMNDRPWVRFDDHYSSTYEMSVRCVATGSNNSTPIAIQTEDGNLDFSYDTRKYAAGENYTYEYEGETKTSIITNVWTLNYGDEQSWSEDEEDEITSVSINPSMKNSRPKDISCWFANLNINTIGNLQNLNTEKVKKANFAFLGMGAKSQNITEINLDLSGFDFGNLETSIGMFYMLGSESSVNKIQINMSNMDTTRLKDINRMFGWIGSATDAKTIINLENTNVSSVETANYAFAGIAARDLDAESLGDEGGSTSSDLFASFLSNETKIEVNLNGWDTRNLTSAAGMFYKFGSNNFSKSEVKGIETLAMEKVTDFSSMFQNTNLRKLDLSQWNTSSAISMSKMFYLSYLLTSLKTGSFETSKVKNMSQMFMGAGLQLSTFDISSFNTENVTNMSGMFALSSVSSLDLRNIDTSKAISMSGMFASMYSIKELDISNFDFGRVMNMSSMFEWNSNLEYIIMPETKTGNITSMKNMFAHSGKLTEIDLTSFDYGNSLTGKTNLELAFADCTSLETIFVKDSGENGGWDNEKISSVKKAFLNDTNLEGGAGTKYSDEEYQNSGYIGFAYIDAKEGNRGYLTVEEHPYSFAQNSDETDNNSEVSNSNVNTVTKTKKATKRKNKEENSSKEKSGSTENYGTNEDLKNDNELSEPLGKEIDSSKASYKVTLIVGTIVVSSLVLITGISVITYKTRRNKKERNEF